MDFIALSFVRSAEDVTELRGILGAKAKNIKIIAKIEDQEGVTHVHDIVRAADGVMVARGDLGIETNIADLPNVQRRIVHSAAKWGKRSIVATHLLESMIENPIPTRAEVTDVANAIYEGVDAIMLSGETSVGKHPVRCVEQLDDIARSSERWPGLGYEKELVANTDKQHIGSAGRGHSCQRHRGHYPARHHRRSRHERAAAKRAHLRVHQPQPDAAPHVAESGRLRPSHAVLQRSRDHAAEGVVISDVLAEKNSDAIQLRHLD